MDKKSVLQILDSPNDEIQGKAKNLVWCNPEQKRLCIAVQETYEFAEADAASRTFPKEKLSTISMLACGKHDPLLAPPDQNDRELKNYWNACRNPEGETAADIGRHDDPHAGICLT